MRRFTFAALLVTAALMPACAAHDAGPQMSGDARLNAAPALVPFASDAGAARLARASPKADFALLANQFEAQYNGAICGPTSAAIVLNAARAQVLGEPITIGSKAIRDFGYQLRQFDEMLRGNGLATRLVIVDDAISEQAIRTDLANNPAHAGDYVIVNHRREAVGQMGDGHISPLGAYDASFDSFLMLDVNPAAAGWAWMPTTLIRAMRTFDTVENRGYLLVHAAP